jgi:hypothetical protein
VALASILFVRLRKALSAVFIIAAIGGPLLGSIIEDTGCSAKAGIRKKLRLFRHLAGSRCLGLRSARLRVLRYAIVGEVTPLYEVDRGVLLGGLGFAESLNVRGHLLLVGGGSLGGHGE